MHGPGKIKAWGQNSVRRDAWRGCEATSSKYANARLSLTCSSSAPLNNSYKTTPSDLRQGGA